MPLRRFNETRLTDFQARYGEEVSQPAPPEKTNIFVERILRRRSIREFKTDPLAPGTIEYLIALAQSAPTSHMAQLWSVVVVERGETRDRIEEFYKRSQAKWITPREIRMLEQAPVILIWLADLSRLKQLELDVSYAELSVMALMDTTIAAQTLSLSAESMGIGTCYCGAFRSLPLIELKQILNLPPHVIVASGMYLGYAEKDMTVVRDVNDKIIPKPRLPQEVVCHRNTYKPTTIDVIKHYDNIIMDYNVDPRTPAAEKTLDESLGWIAQIKRRANIINDNLKLKIQKSGLFLK